MATMFFALSAVLGVASATNILAYGDASCANAAYLGCDNIGPNTCCNILSNGGTTGATSAQWQNLPGESAIYGFQRTRDGNPCGSEFTSNVVGGGSVCVTVNPSDGEYSGLSYGSASKRRDDGKGVGSKCTTTQLANELGLADGTKYNLEGMSVEMIQELWELGKKGVSLSEIPEKFAHFAF